MQRACRRAPFSQTAWYRPGTSEDQAALWERIRELALASPRFHLCVLQQRDGWNVSQKHVQHRYRLVGLQVRMRMGRRKHMALHREPAPMPTGRSQRWSIDLVLDALSAGRAFRVLTVVDQ